MDPRKPRGPWEPSNPRGPWGPKEPSKPRGPRLPAKPCAPVLPAGPRAPVLPCGPGGPGMACSVLTSPRSWLMPCWMSIILLLLFPMPTAMKLPAVSSSLSVAAKTAFREAMFCFRTSKSVFVTSPLALPAVLPATGAAAALVCLEPPPISAMAATAPIATTTSPTAAI